MAERGYGGEGPIVAKPFQVLDHVVGSHDLGIVRTAATHTPSRIVIDDGEGLFQRSQTVLQVFGADAPTGSLNHKQRPFPRHSIPELDPGKVSRMLASRDLVLALRR